MPSSEATEITIAEVVKTPDVPTIDGATAEIPFVPASQRQTTVTRPEIIDDAIVVVGQRQKKRKRATKKSGTTGGSDAKANGDDGGVVAPFDFASAPNVLDDGGEQDDDDGGIGGRVGKRKRQKKGFLGARCRVYVCLTRTDFIQNEGISRRRQRTGGRLKAEMCRILSARKNADARDCFCCLLFVLGTKVMQQFAHPPPYQVIVT